MAIPNKTLKSGFTIPLAGKGTWMTNIGRKPRPSLNDEKRIEEIKNAIAGGISYIDTAERYANGYGETLIGNAIKGHKREKLFLSSKVSSDHLSYDSVISSAKSSLKRLQTSYLDLYTIHQLNPQTPLKETMRAMDYLIENKLIKNIGVYNFSIKQLEEAQLNTKNKISANYLEYSLMHREPENSKIIEYCQNNDIMIIAHKSFQQDFISPETNDLLNETANNYKKTPRQIAAIWLISQPNIVVLFKLGSIMQIEKIVEACQIQMEKKEMDLFKNNIPNSKIIKSS